jgi:hypothetical protein
MKKSFFLLMAALILTGSFFSPAWARSRRHKGPSWFEFWDDDHDDDHDEDHEEHEHKYRSRRFYDRRRISGVEAAEIVSNTFSHWRVGEGWEKRTKKKTEIIIPLRYRGQIIGEIKVNPVSRKIMAEEAEHTHKQADITLDQARKTVRRALDKMTVGDEIRLGKHGNFWEVPLMFNGMEVEEIKVGTGSGNILPDLHIVEDAYRHRRRVPPIFRRPHKEDID